MKEIYRSKINTYILLSLVVVFVKCSESESSRWDYTIYQQNIEDSNVRVVRFSAWGGYDTHISDGKLLLKSDRFDEEDVVEGDNFYMLGGIPSNDTITLIDFDWSRKTANSKFPVDSIGYKLGGLNVKKYIYSYDNSVTGHCTYRKIKFDKVTETKDSITFSNCYSSFKHGHYYGNLSFEKGNVFFSKKGDTIRSIAIESLLLSDTVPVICKRTTQLEPNDFILIDSFSSRGIYR